MRGRERFAFTLVLNLTDPIPDVTRRPAEAACILVERPGGRSLDLDLHPMLRSGSERASMDQTDAAMAAREPTRQVLGRRTSPH
jgi:hypothetical protein